MNRHEGFSAELRRKQARVWDAEKHHPFILGLGDGSLPTDRFQYYLSQDYVFLIDYCRVVALIAAKTEDLDDMAWFARLLDATLNTEMSLHVGVCGDLGISPEQLKSTRPSPTTAAYTRHLLECAYSRTPGETSAALLPCAWGYSEIGRMLQDRGAPLDKPVYGQWIDTYSSTEFQNLAVWLRSFVDRAAEAGGVAMRSRMAEVFATSSRYEYMFWDAAYRMEGWPV